MRKRASRIVIRDRLGSRFACSCITFSRSQIIFSGLASLNIRVPHIAAVIVQDCDKPSCVYEFEDSDSMLNFFESNPSTSSFSSGCGSSLDMKTAMQ